MKRWTRNQKIEVTGLALTGLTLFATYVLPSLRSGPAPKGTSAPRQPGSATILAAKNGASPTIEASTKVHGATAPTIGDLRKMDGVSRIRETESDKTLAEIPVGSFGFADAEDLISTLRSQKDIRLQRYGSSADFEIHKLGSRPSQLVGYVGPETLERIRSGLSQADRVTLYSDPLAEAHEIVTLPVGQLNCHRDRMLLIPKERRVIMALDCEIR